MKTPADRCGATGVNEIFVKAGERCDQKMTARNRQQPKTHDHAFHGRRRFREGKLEAGGGQHDFASFKDAVSKAAIGQFGSGWGWAYLQGGRLTVRGFPNQDNPLMEGGVPVLGVDVWEHAYYLKYQNKRPDYVAAWWNTVSWDGVNRRLAAAR